MIPYKMLFKVSLNVMILYELTMPLGQESDITRSEGTDW